MYLLLLLHVASCVYSVYTYHGNEGRPRKFRSIYDTRRSPDGRIRYLAGTHLTARCWSEFPARKIKSRVLSFSIASMNKERSPHWHYTYLFLYELNSTQLRESVNHFLKLTFATLDFPPSFRHFTIFTTRSACDKCWIDLSRESLKHPHLHLQLSLQQSYIK